MNEYEWPTELDLDEPEPTLSPATVRMLGPDTLRQLRRIQEWNQRQRELSRVQFAPEHPEDSELSVTAFFTVIAAEAAVIGLAAWFLSWLFG